MEMSSKMEIINTILYSGYYPDREVMMSFLSRLFKRNVDTIDNTNMPAHIALIMDGNGRWAKKRGLPRNIGHREGSNTLRKIVKACSDIGIKYLTVYAFSTENWKRPKSEVDALMTLLLEYLKNADRELAGNNIRIRIIGDMNGLSDDIKQEVAKVEKSTSKNTGMNLVIALNYGGRDEIVNAVRNIARDVKNGKLKPDEITEQTITGRLYTMGIPDPDLLIRTSGEMRLSNFLLWQLGYAEFWYTDVLWPDFDKDELMKAISEYQQRNRRYGGI